MMGRKVGDLLGPLGLSADTLGRRLGDVAHRSRTRLDALQVAFGRAALEGNKFMADLEGGRVALAPASHNPPPAEARARMGRFLTQTYARDGASRPHAKRDPFRALLEPKTTRAARLTHLVQTNPRVRAAFERAAGARVVLDGRADGRLTLVDGAPPVTARARVSAQTAAERPTNIYDLFMHLDAEVLKQAQAMAPEQYADPGQYGSGLMPFALSGARSPFATAERESGDEDELGDGQWIAGPGGVDDLLHAHGRNRSSEDVGVLRLKRLNDKREHMYDIYRNSIDKYNQSARAAIDNMKA